MERQNIYWLPIAGVVVAMTMLAIATFQYAGDVHWTRLTVSLLCAQNLPDGTANLGRGLPIVALLLLCASMSLLFELISRLADLKSIRKTIQIGGIGSMVYALLTATPMHNLMVNIALAFFLVAMSAILFMLHFKQQYGLATAGLACVLLKIGSVSLYYTNTYTEAWGVLQKLSFLLTTTWLFAVLLMAKRKTGRDISNEGIEVGNGSEIEAPIKPATR